MALTSSQIEAIIEKLEAAVGTGRASIEYEGRRVQYHSADQILKAIEYFRARLKDLQPIPGPTQSFAQFRKD